MKICFISHSARLGGAEMVLLETIKVLQESGAQCYAVLPGRGPLLMELERLRVPALVTSYALWTSEEAPSWPRRTRALASITARSLMIAWRVWRWGCDIIYSNTSTVCVGAFVAVLLGLPHVWHMHEFGSRMGRHFIFGEKWSHRVIDELSSLVIAPSRAVEAELRNWLHTAPVRVIYCSLHRALQKDESTASRNGKYRCVTSGALCANKRQEDAVLALAELKQRQADAELLVIGEDDGDYADRLRYLVQHNQLQDRVNFLGELENPMPQIRAADVVLVCSLTEGFGRTTTEAMLAGKPVIGADNSATAELIRDGTNGLLYRTADPKDLAGKIEYLLRHPDIAQQLGRRGQGWASRMFTRDRYREQLLPLLNQLLPPDAWRAGS